MKCYNESPQGYDSVDWFLDEGNQLEKEMAFHFKTPEKDIIIADEA